MNLATLLEGPANLTHRGQKVHVKGGLTLTPLSEIFKIDSDQFGSLDNRALEHSVVVSGTPLGVMTADLIGMTHRWQNPTPGQLITPRYDIDSVDIDADTLTLVGVDAPRPGCPILISAFLGSTLPAGLVEGTLYYWGEEGTVHTSEEDAIAGDSPVNITDLGTGDFAMIEQEYIQIDAISANRRIVFHNGAVSVMPPIIHSTIATLFGPMSFVAFIRNNIAWATANSLYTVTKVALSDSPPDKTTIPTQEYSLGWGGSPWTSFKSRGPVTVTPTLSTTPIPTDARGNVGLKIDEVSATATLQPQGFTHQQMLDVLELQGGSVARGKSRARGDLVITGTGVFTTVYNASARELPQTFQTSGPLAGQLAAVSAFKDGKGHFRFATDSGEE